MVQRLFILLLISGGLPLVPSVPRKFYLIMQNKNWTEAQTYCRQNHEDLVTIESADDIIKLQTEAQNHQFSSRAWIGLYNDINNWFWSYGHEPLGSFRPWLPGSNEPSYRYEECGVIRPGGWGDAYCNDETYYFFICFDERNSGDDRYIFYNNTKSWRGAQTFCRETHTDLATARDSAESLIIQSKVINWTWFGLYREAWRWSDQTSVSTINWTSNQPDYYQGDEYCGNLKNGLVENTLCSDLMPFFCYSRDPREFHLIMQNKTWTEAQTYCRQNHEDLVTIESADDIIKLQTEAQNHQFSSRAWIGLYNDINNWFWSYGHEPLGSFRSWYPGGGEPSYKHEECGVIGPGGWADASCNDNINYYFICFDESYSGASRYIFYYDVKSWRDAQTFCRETHTDLATARDSAESLIIQSKVFYWTWFGLYREAWRWSDQTNVSTINWASNQPDYSQGAEYCGILYNSLVENTLCSDLKPFFCYSKITGQQQIMKIKVQSDQDVNDPAVKAAILEQIKQKLKDDGMVNVTVKFRELPNGKVFQKLDPETHRPVNNPDSCISD